MISTGETPDSPTRALWKSYQQSSLVAMQEELAKKIMNLALRSIYFVVRTVFLHAAKSYDMGAQGFTSLPKERVV
jgi:hypothetical protein